MHSYDLSQCLPALFILFHLNTAGERRMCLPLKT